MLIHQKISVRQMLCKTVWIQTKTYNDEDEVLRRHFNIIIQPQTFPVIKHKNKKRNINDILPSHIQTSLNYMICVNVIFTVFHIRLYRA